MAILQVSRLSKEFGGLKALEDVTFTVQEQTIHGIIGPNGSGKTTLFNVISGYYKPTSGEIRFAGETIHTLSPYQIARRGMARTFQNLRLFKKMTVLENVCTVLDRNSGVRLWDYVLRPGKVLRVERAVTQQAEKLLDQFRLLEWRDTLAESLPYGVQKRLELARALAAQPRLLLLDEPAAGLNHTETDELSGYIQDIQRNLGITVVVIEHDMKLVMSICKRLTVMNEGKVLTEGSPKEVSQHPAVVAAYLGGQW
ncbi:MAG: ABC transporter ATP-binding protein [Alicyclobacillus sp.]|nr:ABC transporter ATP-binding protein [Alicyclobacillus sp.]